MTGVQNDPAVRPGAPIPALGRRLYSLLGSAEYNINDFSEPHLEWEPDEKFDELLTIFADISPNNNIPLDTPWTRRIFGPNAAKSTILKINSTRYNVRRSNVNVARKRYKPVDRKVRPVPSYMPDPSACIYKPIEIPPIPPLPLDPPFRSAILRTPKLTEERLNHILNSIPQEFLSSRETDLLTWVLFDRENALAFTDAERGTFSREHFPDYEIPVIEHTPWIQEPIRFPKSQDNEIRRLVREQTAAGKYEVSAASYRSRLWVVSKKDGSLRLVQDVQELNKVTVRDSALPPRPDDFAEDFAGRVIYGCIDLYSGYDARIIANHSRPLTTFHSPEGPRRNTALPQGSCNALNEFQRSSSHTIQPEIPDHGNIFIDDCGLMGPKTTYDNEEIAPGIRRFVYEYATTLHRFLTRFIVAGITASGWKFVLATPKLEIVGSVVDAEGWHLKKGVATKVINWPVPRNVSEVRGFLGIAGVARRWIKGFSLIARPLTELTRITMHDFEFGERQMEAFDTLKQRITQTPVLVKIDYDKASMVSRADLANDANGLVIAAVDSCKFGAGWVLYQIHNTMRKPAIFGSRTFSAVESRYSQPKAELYGLFCALRDLRHRVWGVPFRVEADASFLKQMIANPGDLPNAPMIRWVMYIGLFDFELKHVPADKHVAPDGLSRRPRADEDSDDSDVEDYLDHFLASPSSVKRHPESPIIIKSHQIKSFISSIITKYNHQLEDSRKRHPPTIPYAFFASPTFASHSFFASYRYDTSNPFISSPHTLLHHSLLKNSPDLRIVRQVNRNEPEKLRHRIIDLDEPQFWRDLKTYLEHGTLPRWSSDYFVDARTFKRRAQTFFFADNELWKLSKDNGQPRKVIINKEKRTELVAIAHNDIGHRGRDSIYKLLTDRYYWPGMFEDVAYFTASCNICQLRSRQKPTVPFSPTWNTTILRTFHLDTKQLEKGFGGKKYLLRAIEPSIGWPEARAVGKNNSENWAKFIFEEIITRFGCIPVFVADGGPEFMGAVDELFRRYGVIAIISSPYNPKANGVVERSHQTLVNSILRLCGTNSKDWPKYVHAALLAMRCTTNRMTGYSPYFMLYGKHPILAFELNDPSWHTINWAKIRSDEELISARVEQITRRNDIEVEALERQRSLREKALENFMRKHAGHLTTNEFELGTWVLKLEAWLEKQMGNKTALRWTGPYIIHSRQPQGGYKLRELNGVVMRDTVPRDQLKIFYYRQDNQTIRSIGSSFVIHTPASFKVSFVDSCIQEPINNKIKYYPTVVGKGWGLGKETTIKDIMKESRVLWMDEEGLQSTPAAVYVPKNALAKFNMLMI